MARLWRFFRLLHGTVDIVEVEEEFADKKKNKDEPDKGKEYTKVPMDAVVPRLALKLRTLLVTHKNADN